MALSHWDAPTGAYTSRIPPGTAAFRDVVAEQFEYARAEVIRDKSRCAQKSSEHCECGAVDFYTRDVAKGRKLFDWCVAYADTLGIQSVIFNHRVVGFGNAAERRYTGENPHEDHVHVGLNRWARQNLTRTLVLSKIVAPTTPEEPMTPAQEQKLQETKQEAHEAKLLAGDAKALSSANQSALIVVNQKLASLAEKVDQILAWVQSHT